MWGYPNLFSFFFFFFFLELKIAAEKPKQFRRRSCRRESAVAVVNGADCVTRGRGRGPVLLTMAAFIKW